MNNDTLGMPHPLTVSLFPLLLPLEVVSGVTLSNRL